MNEAAWRRGLAACILCLLGMACSPDSQMERTTVNTDLKQLDRLMTLTVAPQAAQWEVIESGGGGLGPSDWGLVALLRFTPDQRRALLGTAAAQSRDPLFPANFMRSWFPPELSGLWKVSEGGWQLTAQPLAADAFQHPPLSQGFMLPVGDEGDLFVYLYTQ